MVLKKEPQNSHFKDILAEEFVSQERLCCDRPCLLPKYKPQNSHSTETFVDEFSLHELLWPSRLHLVTKYKPQNSHFTDLLHKFGSHER